jgi:HEPN domain-containing protein
MSATSAFVRQWADKAEQDLRTAEQLLNIEEDCPFDHVTFHAQQCAEKYLKALLVERDTDFPRTHSLRILIQLLEVGGLPAGLDVNAVLSLTPYAVESRYPGDYAPIERSEATVAVGVARQVREAIRTVIAHIN